jgi:hypothetical protein
MYFNSQRQIKTDNSMAAAGLKFDFSFPARPPEASWRHLATKHRPRVTLANQAAHGHLKMKAGF